MTAEKPAYFRRQVTEWTFHSRKVYENPFIDVTLDVVFQGPNSQTFTVPAFYDGGDTWKVRFNPNQSGSWLFRSVSTPPDDWLDSVGFFEVQPSEARGFLRSTPGQAWGFQYENGDPAFIFGDTTYNLFGMAYCGGDVRSFLERRARQGFNLLRVRLPVSPFHPPEGYSAWQTRRTWPWGGSEQAPRFDQLNLDYFRTVDEVVHTAEMLGIGLEMIMEAWGFEFPFNSRNIFVPEWEELWLRYLIARYDAFNCVYFWTPMNEYEFYPNGDWHHKLTADRWAMRIARWVKSTGQHGHILSIHNGPRLPAFAHRFAADPQAVDAILFQSWGTVGEQDSWLAAGIDEEIHAAFDSWWGSRILAEWGYERNPSFELLLPGHRYCDPEHTRRGAWRGAFSGMGIIHGFENSWGPWMLLEKDQPGMEFLLHLRHFFTGILSFWKLQPRPELASSDELQPGYQPRVLASADQEWIAVYFPAGGCTSLNLPEGRSYSARWFNPVSGELGLEQPGRLSGQADLATPASSTVPGVHPADWVLVLSAR